MEPAIRIEHLSKTFLLLREKQMSLKSAVLSFRRHKPQSVTVMNDLSLVVNHGETVAVIGKNGSGKSTLLGIIGKVYRPTSGSVQVEGRMFTMLDAGANAGFHPELTGRENIFFNGAIMGLTTRQIKARLDQIIEFSELDDYIDSPVKTYSAGMMMRLGFAIGVETDPDILLIDEALAVGDAAFQEKCYQRIRKFQSEGRTIIFVTHDLAAARAVASRALWIDKGELKMDGGADHVIDSYLAATVGAEHAAGSE